MFIFAFAFDSVIYLSAGVLINSNHILQNRLLLLTVGTVNYPCMQLDILSAIPNQYAVLSNKCQVQVFVLKFFNQVYKPVANDLLGRSASIRAVVQAIVF